MASVVEGAVRIARRFRERALRSVSLGSREQARSLAAAAVVFSLGASFLFKMARAFSLGSASGSYLPPLVRVPGAMGQDFAVAALLGFTAYAAGRLLPRAAAVFASGVPLVLLAGLMPMDFMAYRLTGTSITWQRFQGAEGATLRDVTLLATRDFVLSTAGILLLVIGACLCLWLVPNSKRIVRLASLPKLTLLGTFGLALATLQRSVHWQDYGLSEHTAVALAESMSDPGVHRAVAVDKAAFSALLRDSQAPRAEPVELRSGRPKNVVVFLAEGIPYKHTSFARSGRDSTPNLRKRFERHGVLFNRYYATWHSSIQAIFSIVCSQFPPIHVPNIVRLKPRIDCGELSEVFSRSGYHPGLFHGGRFSYYSKLALLGGRGYEITKDAEDFASGGKYPLDKWGTDDRALVEHTLRWIDGIPRDEPFVALLIPITAHYPFDVPADFERPFEGDDSTTKFQNAVAFQDAVFEKLLTAFESRGLYESTLFAWLGDHGNSVGEPLRETPGMRQFYQPSLHTPLVLINAAAFGPATVSSRLGSHLDLMPTLLDLVGLRPDARARGQSLVADSYEPRRVFFGAGGFLGFVEGSHKFVYGLRNERLEYYDLQSDPLELNNLADTLPTDRSNEGVRLVERFRDAVSGYFESAPTLIEEVSIADLHANILKLGEFRYRTKDGEYKDCNLSEDAASRSCPDVATPITAENLRQGGWIRPCLLFEVPPKGGRYSLRLKDAPTLELLSGSTVSIVEKGRKVEFRAKAFVDGHEHDHLRVNKSRSKRLEHPRAHKELRFELTGVTKPKKRTRLCLSLAAARKSKERVAGR